MKIAILTPDHFLTSKWSGGSTTQLYIFPSGATYADRNFDLRISSAIVEVEQSTFTSLPGIQRKLMILEGEIRITHQGQYTKLLKPFDVDTFSGDWKTTSLGRCTDFNVMTSGIHQSEFYQVAIWANSWYVLKPKETCRTLFLYATHDRLHIQLANENYILETGNLMVIEELNTSRLPLFSCTDFGLVVLEIHDQ